jgi:hypothetical protein
MGEEGKMLRREWGKEMGVKEGKKRGRLGNRGKGVCVCMRSVLNSEYLKQSFQNLVYHGIPIKCYHL